MDKLNLSEKPFRNALIIAVFIFCIMEVFAWVVGDSPLYPLLSFSSVFLVMFPFLSYIKRKKANQCQE